MNRPEPLTVTIHNLCDFCEGTMDNCPYCRGRGRYTSTLNTRTNTVTDDEVSYRPGEPDPDWEPFRVPDWHCPSCGALRPCRSRNSTGRHILMHNKYPMDDGEVLYECCGFITKEERWIRSVDYERTF